MNPGSWHPSSPSNWPSSGSFSGGMGTGQSGGNWWEGRPGGTVSPSQQLAFNLAKGNQAMMGDFLGQLGGFFGGGGAGGGAGGGGSQIPGPATTSQPDYSPFGGLLPGSNTAPSYAGRPASQLAQSNVGEAGLGAYYPATTGLWQTAMGQNAQQGMGRYAEQLQDILSGSQNQLLAQQPALGFVGNLLRSILS